MNKSKTLKRIVLLTIAVVVIVSVVGISYAAWANKLTADKVFELKAAEVTHLTFGGQGDLAIAGQIEPGAMLSSVATVKTTNATLNVTFAISKLEVKLANKDTFETVTGADSTLFTLSIAGNNSNTIAVGNTSVDVTFNFTMRATNVDTEKYPSATFRLTVAATGALPK